MKLYLSSYRIPNAKDYELPDTRAQKLDELLADIAQSQLKADIIDLRDYEGPDTLKEVLGQYDLLWVAGGNTYVLRCEMHRSGLDQVIKGLLQEGMVYGGESAGAIVAGITLVGFETADDPDLANEVYWDGLGLVDKIIAPHMDSPDFVEYANHIKKVYAGDNRVVYLSNDQAYVVDGTEQRVVGSL